MKKLILETHTEKIYWDEKNEVVWVVVFKSVQTLSDAIENIDAHEKVKNMLNKRQIRVLVELGNLTKISQEARQYFGNERTASIHRATALITSSSITMMIANFFMGFNKPLSPTHMFSNTGEAIKWLHTFSKR